jgi:hypothetical protein
VSSGIPTDPKEGRQRTLVAFLRAAIVAVAAFAVAGLVAPEPWDRRVGNVVVGLLVSVPAGRAAWLVVRWVRKGDRRFAAVGVVLLAVMASGYVLGR